MERKDSILLDTGVSNLDYLLLEPYGISFSSEVKIVISIRRMSTIVPRIFYYNDIESTLLKPTFIILELNLTEFIILLINRMDRS